jgi:hypothetical protein
MTPVSEGTPEDPGLGNFRQTPASIARIAVKLFSSFVTETFE